MLEGDRGWGELSRTWGFQSPQKRLTEHAPDAVSIPPQSVAEEQAPPAFAAGALWPVIESKLESKVEGRKLVTRKIDAIKVAFAKKDGPAAADETPRRSDAVVRGRGGARVHALGQPSVVVCVRPAPFCVVDAPGWYNIERR